MQRIVIAATSDIVTDQRIRKVAGTLHEAGFDVLVVGRIKRDSLPMDGVPFRVHRLALRSEAGPRFYAEYNARLFHLLLRTRVDLVNANDLDTLLAGYLAARLKSVPLVYDSHEYFTGIPEIQHRPMVKTTWRTIERAIFPRLQHVYTVNDSIARLYRNEYGKDVRVIRNLPLAGRDVQRAGRKELGLPEDRHLLILQGTGINVDRGAEEAVKAMRHLDRCLLLIIGSGDVFPRLEQMVSEFGLEDRVRLMGKLPWEQLMRYTAAADLGLTLDKDTNVNYRFSLPNKVFDYIKAGTPIIASHLVEIEKIVRGYDIGALVESHEPTAIAAAIRSALEDDGQRARWQRNLLRAQAELTWESQASELVEIYRQALQGSLPSREARIDG